MAFDISNLTYHGVGSGQYFTYTTGTDSKATTKNAAYWSNMVGLMEEGTTIKVTASDGVYVGAIRYISASQPVPEVLLET